MRAKWGEAQAEELEANRVTVAVAGRIMAIRAQGKAGFATLQQEGERLQIYVRLDAVGEQGFALYKLLDMGDHIGVVGLPVPHADRRTHHPRGAAYVPAPRPCWRCRRNFTAWPMWSCAIGSAMWTCLRISIAAKCL